MKGHLVFLFLDLLDLMGSLVLLVFQVLLALQVHTSLPVMSYVNQAPQVPQELQVIKVSKENKDLKVTKVIPASTVLQLVFQDIQANLVYQVSLVLQDLLVSLDRRVKKDSLGKLAQKDYPAYQELLVLQDFLELKGNLVTSSVSQE